VCTLPTLWRCPFIQRLRSWIAGHLAAVVTLLSLGKIKVDPTGTFLSEKGRDGLAQESMEAPPPEPPG